MTPRTAHDLIIVPTLKFLAVPYDTQEARILLLTIGLTESAFTFRAQVNGPAGGFWQFERGGGAAEFQKEERLAAFRKAAIALNYPITASATMNAIKAGADTLACIMARAILWLEPKPLPAPGDRSEAYRQYLARWRPGKPSSSRFTQSYETAMRVVVRMPA